MSNEEYISKLKELKIELDSLTSQLWKERSIRERYSSKEHVEDLVVEDIFTFQKGALNIQLEK